MKSKDTKTPVDKIAQQLKDSYENEIKAEKEKNKKSSIKVLDVCICFVFIFITLYTAVVLVIYATVGGEPTALTAGVFGIFSGELLMCMLLQRTKIQIGKKDNDDDDDDDDDDDMNNIVVG